MLGIYISLLAKPAMSSNLAKIDKFYADCASGSLPSFCIVDPDFDKQSEEDPQDIQYGDAFLAQVVNAVMSGPKWSKTMLIWNYDEHGGYYDHVAPPAAATPDDIPPDLAPVMSRGGSIGSASGCRPVWSAPMSERTTFHTRCMTTRRC